MNAELTMFELECCEKPSPAHICTFPTELLKIIFRYLPARDLIISGQVCKRWKDIVEAVSSVDDIWKQYCASDFKLVYKDAKRKSNACKLFFDIYKSLTLWSRLATASEQRDEFCHSSGVSHEIESLHIHENGIISVRKRSYVAFYDTTTFEMTNRKCLNGYFSKFEECDDVDIILTGQLHIHILPHSLICSYHEQDPRFIGIIFFLVAETDLYLLSLHNDIFYCSLDDLRNVQKLQMPITKDIVTLSVYNGCLHCLTIDREVYVYKNNEFVKLVVLSSQINPFDFIWRYRFLESIDWRLFYVWLIQMKIYMPNGPLLNIRIVKQYGDIFFVGTSMGKFLIYYKPYTNGELEFRFHQPVKEYCFIECCDFPVFSIQPVLHIDVVEIKDGHKVFVAIPTKIIVLTYLHEFGKVKSKTIVPYTLPGLFDSKLSVLCSK